MLPDPIVIWDLPDDPLGNVAHIEPTGITLEEVEEVLQNPRNRVERSRRHDSQFTRGWTTTGKYIGVAFEEVDDDPRMVRPFTAYPVPEPKGRNR